MHPEAYGFVAECVAAIGGELGGARVVDIGGAVWGDDVPVTLLFAPWRPSEWLIVDPAPDAAHPHYGKGNPIHLAHWTADQLEANAEHLAPFDVAVCTEVLEHAQPEPIIRAAARVLRTGGRLLITCAGQLRPPHPMNGHTWQGAEHYRGVAPGELLELAERHGFTPQLGPRSSASLYGQDTYALFRRVAGRPPG